MSILYQLSHWIYSQVKIHRLIFFFFALLLNPISRRFSSWILEGAGVYISSSDMTSPQWLVASNGWLAGMLALPSSVCGEARWAAGCVLQTPDTRLCLRSFLSVLPCRTAESLQESLPTLSWMDWELGPVARGGDVEARWSPDLSLPASSGPPTGVSWGPDPQPEDLGSRRVWFIESQETQRPGLGDDGGAWPSVADQNWPPGLGDVGRGGCPCETLSLSPRTHFLPSFSIRIWVWQDLWAGSWGSEVWLPEKAVPPQPGSSSKLCFWCSLSGFQQAVDGHHDRTHSKQRGSVGSLDWAGIGSQTPGPTCSGRCPCMVMSEDQPADTRISGPEDLPRPHHPLLLPPVHASQPPSPEVFPERKGRKSPGLACLSCPSDSHGSG